MREPRFLGTRRSSPLRGRFRDSETAKDNWQARKRRFSGLHELEWSPATSAVRKPECGTDRNCCSGLGDDRSRNISQYNKSVNLGESPSIKKFQWNNLLEGNFESPNSSMKHVSDFGTHAYEISVDKSCQGEGFSDSVVVPLSTSIENDNSRKYSVCLPHLVTTRNHGHIDASLTSPLANSGTFLQNNREIPWSVGNAEVFFRNKGQIPRPWEHQDVAKHSPGQPLYDQGGENMSGSGVTLGYGVPISQPKAFLSSSAAMDDNLPRCSAGFNRSREMPDEYLQQDGRGQTPCSNPPEISQTRLMKLAERGRRQSSLFRVMDGDTSYSEMQRCEMDDAGKLPDDILYSRRPSIVDSIVNKIDGIGSSHGDPLRIKGLLGEPNLSTEEHLIPNYHDLTQPSNKTERYTEGLCSRNTHPDYDYGIEGYDNIEGWGLNTCKREAIPTIPLNYHSYEGEAIPMNYQDTWKELPDNDQCFYGKESNYIGILATEQLAMHDLDADMVKLKRSMDENQIWTKSRSQFASDSDYNLNDEEEISFDEDIIYLQFGDQLTSPYPPSPSQRNSKKHIKVVGKGIKERLRPAQNIPVSNSSRRSVLERLGPRVAPTLNTFSVKRKKNKTSSRNLYDFCGSTHFSNLSKVGRKLSKTEPPEYSEEFKQQVHNAFLRFVKLLNENPAQRRKYADQGGSFTLKCSICGSKSKEFANTVSLAMHSLKSYKAGCRAEHLGFHKALCALLGWSDTVAPNGSWVQQMLPAAEASTLKNDLIIWPPVVVVHNLSIAQNNPDERMIVSVEELEAILSGVGFSGGKIKVSRGKPANFSILVVAFNSTLSGLQEAERLNKFYYDNKHGRAGCQQIDSSGFANSNVRSLYIPGNKESALYGYLGNAGDLDKLDFERKKHSVVKSKKEIKAMVVPSLS